MICPDLRGYGASSKPADGYDKRTMAQDIVDLAAALGHERFALAGHDRGAHVAFRAGLDHPDRVTHLAILDVLPTPEMWDVLRGVDAAVAFHLYLMAQPPGLPEQLIAGAPDAFFGYFLDAWGTAPFEHDVRAAYLEAEPQRDPVDRRRLPRHGHDRPRTRPRRPGRRAHVPDARDRRPAGLGRSRPPSSGSLGHPTSRTRR